MSLFRTIIDAGLAANLKQNELKVLLVLLRQTIGFGKSHDHLTDKRMAKLAGLRVDRCRMALDGLIEKGLFEGLESNDFDFRYDIPAHFLAEHEGVFFTPHIPKNRDIPRNSGDISEEQRHTSLTSTPLTPQQPHACGGGEQDQHKQAVTLPDGISPENQQACLKAATTLTDDQQARVNHAYRSFSEDKPVRSPAGLYLTLVKAEQSGTLIVPEAATTTEPVHASFQSFDDRSSESESQPEQASKLAWLRDTARREGVSIEQLAAQMGMTRLLSLPNNYNSLK